MARYNGWKNHATWNVALWLGNDEGLYNLARAHRDEGYKALAETLRESGSLETADGVSWTDSGLDIPRLDALLREF